MERADASFLITITKVWLDRDYRGWIIHLIIHQPGSIGLTVRNICAKAILPIYAARAIIRRNVTCGLRFWGFGGHGTKKLPNPRASEISTVSNGPRVLVPKAAIINPITANTSSIHLSGVHTTTCDWVAIITLPV